MPIVSPWPSLEPYPKEPLAPWLEGASLRWGDKPAFLDRDGSIYSFRQVFTSARRIGRLLQEEGVAKGDRVAVISPNSPSLIIAALGVIWTGAIVQLLSPLLRERELKYFLALSGARASLVAGDLLARVEGIRGELPELAALYPMEELEGKAREVPPEPRPVALEPQKDGVVLFSTSGTTGLPKGLLHTHSSLIAAVRRLAMAEGRNSLAIYLDLAPLFLSFGFIGNGIGGLFVGVTQVVMPRFDPEEALALIERHRVTSLSLAPAALRALTEAAKGGRYDLSSLRFLVTGTGALPRELRESAQEVFPCRIMQGYGSSETSLMNCNPPLRAKPGSVGPPLPDTLERVMDVDSGEEVSPGETGELLIKGPQLFKSYWQAPEATAEAFTADGWFRTGDLVWADEEGYLYIVGRTKEVIKYKGYQVTPAELEGVLLEHPAVLEAAVIPKEEREVGEVPKALVVLRPGAQATPEELMAFVADRVAPYKKVREVEFIDAIPRSPLGKVLRRELMEQERAKGSP